MRRVLQAGALWLTVVLLLAVTACGGATGAEPTPPTLQYGEDICEFCGMIVSEERHAAAYVTSDGHGHVFDDIGDMVQFHVDQGEDVVAFFVHDFEDEVWIRAETAHYIRSGEVNTPMFSGLAAFASSEQAEALATELQVQMLDFDEVLGHYREMASTSIEVGGEHQSDDH